MPGFTDNNRGADSIISSSTQNSGADFSTSCYAKNIEGSLQGRGSMWKTGITFHHAEVD